MILLPNLKEQELLGVIIKSSRTSADLICQANVSLDKSKSKMANLCCRRK